MTFQGFEPTLFEYLEELADNNDRDWFHRNKQRYEGEVREPALEFIRAFRPHLKKLSPYFVASDNRVGGSLMRVYRDTRFSKDKAPYKTNLGIQFRHEFGRDVHAPGFYVHIEPGECFLAAGVWRPNSDSLEKIRRAIVQWPDRWRRASRGAKFAKHFSLVGDSLKRPPRGFPAEHALVEDLKRTDFIGICELNEQDVLDPQFLERTAKVFAGARSLVRFLCDAMPVPF